MRSLLLVFAFFFSFILLAFPVDASSHTPLPLSEYFTQTWDTRDGLPHNGINALSQSKDGYLWVATWEGLARFNGREFTLFTRGSSSGLPDSGVKSLYTRGDKLLVAGARGGLSERKTKHWYPKKSSKTLINSAIYDNQQGIWVGMEEQGLVYRNETTEQDISVIDNVTVYQLAQDKNNCVWAATNKGLYRVKNKTEVVHYGTDIGLPDKPVFSVLITRAGKLIVGTEKGVFSYEKTAFKPLAAQLVNETVSVLVEDNNDDIWVGTTNHGVFRYSDNGVEKLDESVGLPNSRIFSIYEDQEKSIWIGTSSGLFRLRKAPFITLTNKQGLAGNYVRTVLSHSDGSLWVGSSKGLNHIVDGQVRSIALPKDINDISVLSLAENKQGEVLVGTYTHGVFKVVGQHLKAYLAINDLLDSFEIRSILVDSRENIWLGTTAGVVKVAKSGMVEYINQQTGLPANFIMALAEDSLGNIWIGTGVGVASYANGKLKVYRLNETFNAEYAFGFFTDTDAIWMATDRGILRFDLHSDSVTSLTRKNGLPIDKYFQVLFDNLGAMWLTSNRGIIKITKHEVDKFLKNENSIIDYQRFTEDSGLLSSQANGGSTPAAAIHSDGTIWVATAKGVSQMNYQRLNSISQQKIPVVIEKLMVDGKNYPLVEGRTIALPAGVQHIAIYYAGLGYLNAENIHYQTQLSGFDNAWLDKGKQTYTEFTNLLPGQYTFSMRAKYPDGEWRKQTAQVTFTIKHFYWQTLIFKTLMLMLFFILLYSAYRYRLIKVQQNEDKLKQLVAKQTIELRQQAKMFAYQASHDQLTGLHNRRAFDSWCEDDFKQAKLNSRGLSIAIIDIDHFKRVNDEYSHLIGDEILKVISELMTKQFVDCSPEVKLARWGGEEFTLLLPAFKSQAQVMCEALCTAVRDYDFSCIAEGLFVTISIGISDNKGIHDYEKMISFADQALYCAKFNGRNQVKVYDVDLGEVYKQRNAELKNRRKYD